MIFTSILASCQCKEVYVKGNKIYRDGNRIFIIANGDIDDLIALKTKEVVLEMMAGIPRKVDLIIDLNNVTTQSPGSKRIWSSLKDMIQTRKTALYGITTRIDFVINILQSIPQRKMAFFKTREGAIMWLNKA